MYGTHKFHGASGNSNISALATDK